MTHNVYGLLLCWYFIMSSRNLGRLKFDAEVNNKCSTVKAKPGLAPSKADKDSTMQLKQAAEVMQIKLLDHIIIGGGRYYSFSDEGDWQMIY
jgi:hypothetical protein